MRDHHRGFASRVLDFCVGALLAAMALYGAVQVLQAIWLPLCIALFVAALVGLAGWIVVARLRRF